LERSGLGSAALGPLLTRSPLAEGALVVVRATAAAVHYRPGGTMRTISLFNFAGGCGKSSLTRDVGVALATRGHRVLLIDLDPQHSLTFWLGIDDESVALTDTAFPALETSRGALPEPRSAFGVQLIPSTHSLSRAEPILLSADYGALRLRSAL
jgi:chromosome partitioning protein